MNYKKLFSLEGKNAVITGGAGILGQKFSDGLCEMGAQVAILDYNYEAAKATALQISKKHNRKVIAVEVDVADTYSVKKAIEKVESEFKHIHILHNNAASKSNNLEEFFAPFEKYSLEEWQKIMRINIDGMFLMAQAIGAHMVENKISGSIIQTASIYGIMAPDQRIYEGSRYLDRQINTPAVYSASKASVVGLTKYLSSYWADKGIRVNTLTPGGVESGQNETFKQKYSNRVPMGRMAQDYEMVGALIYLASDASSYVTGQNIVVDGGLSVW